ncbi:MAG: hypothetical protein E7062_02195 [Spirochaetaceae bacterium]|nr:hypothetical protein [Spirochaetaceae bacterium]
MAKTAELFKERMKIRTTNPVRASVLGMLIDGVKKLAKAQNREETDEDLGIVAKKMKDQTLVTIEEYKKGNSDTSRLEEELAVLNEFVPAGLTEEQIEEEVKKALDSLPQENRVLKNIMPLLKNIPGIDMKIAKSIVEKYL